MFTLLWQSFFFFSFWTTIKRSPFPHMWFFSCKDLAGPQPEGQDHICANSTHSIAIPLPVRDAMAGTPKGKFLCDNTICPISRAVSHLNLRNPIPENHLLKEKKRHILFQHRGNQISGLNLMGFTWFNYYREDKSIGELRALKQCNIQKYCASAKSWHSKG